MRELILAAQALTDYQFRIASGAIINNQKIHDQGAKQVSTSKLREEIQISALQNKDKELLLSANDADIYSFARKIILALAQKELKNPLSP